MLLSTTHFPVVELWQIFSQPYHGLLFLGKVIHLHLHVPFALLPWQFLNLVLDLWGGK